jgi:hydroxymethylglutaryl-CoA reductase (NADPH)
MSNAPDTDSPANRPAKRLPATTDCSAEAVEARQDRLREQGCQIDQIAGVGPAIDPSTLKGSIEGFIGFARVPLGIAGPVRIHGAAAQGEFFIPLATSEGTLVASYQHAFNAMNRSGGTAALCSGEQVQRAPCFEFASLEEAGRFATWLASQQELVAATTAGTSRYCRLLDMHPHIVGNTVYLLLEFTTGDAAGQNMVTAAAEATCRQLLEAAPITPASWLVESVLSGDKRASAMSFRAPRGRNASAEVILPARQYGRYWRAAPEEAARAWRQATNGAVQTGAVGLQGNVANALAALFIACGQDVACVAEATTALTRIEVTRDGDLYASVTLPNLIVGTVGGGTHLPTAQECLGMLGCIGAGQARKFAEICAVVALAGELAIVGAMASGGFSSAHATGGRKGQVAPGEPS